MVDIPEQDIRKLDALAAKLKRSRSGEIRSAVERHLRTAENNAWIYGEGYGYWQNRDDIDDPVAYQHAMREDRESD